MASTGTTIGPYTAHIADSEHASIVSWNRFDRGIHLSPQDASDLLIGDLRTSFRGLR
jgi:hypothetical protein